MEFGGDYGAMEAGAGEVDRSVKERCPEPAEDGDEKLEGGVVQLKLRIFRFDLAR